MIIYLATNADKYTIAEILTRPHRSHDTDFLFKSLGRKPSLAVEMRMNNSLNMDSSVTCMKLHMERVS